MEHQAFPDADHYGMTLRDYFAAQALTGLIARRPTPVDSELHVHVSLSKLAYAIADAMLGQRGRNHDKEG